MNKKRKTQKGITLIALVITIIVMLILVGVTISMAVNGGLFNYAGQAVRDTNTQLNAEGHIAEGGIEVDGVKYNSIDEYIRKLAVKALKAYSEDLLNEDGVLEENTKYESEYYTAVIPKGFYLSEDPKEQTIENGLVIKDITDNEFVWIPVKTGEFERTEWAENEPTNVIAENYIENLSNDPTEEYENMLASVNKYGGFYIGRYEAGSKNNRYITRTDETVLVKKGAYPYNYVMWGSEMNEYQAADDTCGHGAVYLCRDMYKEDEGEEDTYGVTSTLCYGVQWDAALRFIRDKVNVTNSIAWGNYYNNEFDFTGKYSSDSGNTWPEEEVTDETKPENKSWLLTTGASEKNKAKNIYDLAGNVYEWTMEAYSSGDRVLRGGYYRNNGSGDPASYRYDSYPDYCPGIFGFRPALYIK